MPRALAILALAAALTPARADDLPAALALVPGDAALFAAVDLPAVAKSRMFDEVRAALAALKPGELAAVEKRTAVPLSAFGRVVVVLPTAETVMNPTTDGNPTALSGLLVVGCTEPFGPAKLTAGLFSAGRPKAYRGRTYHFDEDTWSGVLTLPDRKTFAVGSEDALVWLIDRLPDAPNEPARGGPLAAARVAAAGHTAFVAVNPAAALPTDAPVPESFRPLTAATRMTIAVDLGKALRVAAALDYPDADGAAAGRDALKMTIGLLRTALQGQTEQLARQATGPGPDGDMLGTQDTARRYTMLLGVGLMRQADAVLAGLTVATDGTSVRVRPVDSEIPVGASALVAIAGVTSLGTNANMTFQRVGTAVGGNQAGPRPEEVRLKKLAAALDAYRAEHGGYPPAAVLGKDGTPLLSWRVALLPYLGKKDLYARFKLDEPWDSLHNKTLLAAMPAVFNKPSKYGTNYGRTNTLAVVGPGTPFDGKAGAKGAAGKRLLAVEPEYYAARSEFWTKPADVPAGPGLAARLFGPSDYPGCWALFADGSVEHLTKAEDSKRVPGWAGPADSGK